MVARARWKQVRTPKTTVALFWVVSSFSEQYLGSVAFNSKEGDFFGAEQEDTDESKLNEKRISWYNRIWTLFKFVPYLLFKTARKALLLQESKEFHQPAKDAVEAEALPAGTNAMYGFSSRHAIRNLHRPQEEKVFAPTGRIDDLGKKGTILWCKGNTKMHCLQL